VDSQFQIASLSTFLSEHLKTVAAVMGISVALFAGIRSKFSVAVVIVLILVALGLSHLMLPDSLGMAAAIVIGLGAWLIYYRRANEPHKFVGIRWGFGALIFFGLAVWFISSLVGGGGYASGEVIVGGRARQLSDGAATRGAKQFVSHLVAAFRKKGIPADELRSEAYGSTYFDRLMSGDVGALSDIGLAQRMHAAVLGLIDVTCQSTTVVGQPYVYCRLDADLRLVKSGIRKTSSSESLSETGGGTDQDDAIRRAAERLIEQHPELLDGV